MDTTNETIEFLDTLNSPVHGTIKIADEYPVSYQKVALAKLTDVNGAGIFDLVPHIQRNR